MDAARPGSALAVLNQYRSISTGPPTTPIPLVCRFVPHDQWFLTHLAPYYQGKDVKHHILAKCLNLTYTPPEPPMPFNPSDPTQEPRPPSPITFAPHPSARAASPILFASLTRPKNSVVSSDDDDESIDWDDSLSATKSLSDGGASDSGRPGKARRIYSDDDSADESLPPQGGRVLPMKAPSTSRAITKPKPKTQSPLQPPEDPKAVPRVAHLSFALIRFSTGQVLEDETKLAEQGIHPYELLELHVSFSPLRKAPSSTTVLLPTSQFPFYLLKPPGKVPEGKKGKRRLQELVAAHSVRIVRLPRTIPEAYVLPYWEGWVRILRYVSHSEGDYMYGAHNLVPAAPSKKVAPGPAQYGNGGWIVSGMYDLTTVGEAEKETSLDSNLVANFGLGGRPKEIRPRDRLAHDLQVFTGDGYHARLESRFEWRDRWLVVRDGWFFLLRDRRDKEPTHRFPLNYLFNIRDADRLTESINQAKGSRRTARAREPNPRSPPPMSPRAREKAPEGRSVRSISPNSTLKGAPISGSATPLQSGYGHGRNQMGSKHTPKPSKDDVDPYEEDDEGDRRAADVRTPTSRKRSQSVHQRHQHTTSRASPSQLPRARTRRDLSDPATRARIDPTTFIPNSKEEAEALGMKIICAKFINAESGPRPNPFDGFQNEGEPTPHPKATGYTSTGPTLADVTATVQGGLLGVGGDEEEEPKKKKESGKEKEKDKSGKAGGDPTASRHKSRLSAKGSAPSGLSTDFGSGGKGLSTTGDRRPSLPALAGTSDAWKSKNSFNPTGSMQTLSNQSSTSAFPFTGLFKSNKDKDEKRREKEAKEQRKAEKRRAEQERKEQQELDGYEGTNSGSSWKLPLGKSKRPKDNSATVSTVGTVEEEHLVIQRHREEVGSLHRSSIDTWRTNATYQANNNHHGFSDTDDARFRRPGSARSSISSGRIYPEPSPITFKVPNDGSGAPSPVTPAWTEPSPITFSQPGDGSDSQSPLSPMRFHNPEPFSPIPASSSPLAQNPNPNSPQDGVDVVKGDGGSDSDSNSSISLSSPVFAHDGPSDDEDVESDIELGIPRKRRTGYRYGYQRPEPATGSNAGGMEKAGGSGSLHTQSVSMDGSSNLHSTESSTAVGTIAEHNASQTTVDTNARRQNQSTRFEPSRTSLDTRKRLAKKGEWIIMDFGNDAAYHSLLRILHRHTDDNVMSAFLPDLRKRVRLTSDPHKPVPKVPESTSPPPSPPPKDLPAEKSVPPSPARSTTLRSPAGSLRSRAQSDAAFSSHTRLQKSGAYSDDETDSRLRAPESPQEFQHPLNSLYPPRQSSLVQNGRTGRSHGLGPYQYPEWRLNAVHRARRAGLGRGNRALEYMLLAMNNKDEAEQFDFYDPAFPMERPEWVSTPRKEEYDVEYEGEDEGEETVEDPPESEADDDEDEDPDGNPSFKSFNEEDDETELSELEWQAWYADIPRQIRLRRQGSSGPAFLGPTVPEAYDVSSDESDDASGDSDGPPVSLNGDIGRMRRRRRRREPCGVVTSTTTSTALPGFVAKDTEHHDNEEHRTYHRIQRYPAASLSVGTLSSPSSSESLSRQHLAGRDPSLGATNESKTSSVASSPLSSQAHSRGHSHSISHTLPHKASANALNNNRHSLLHHSTSMQASLLRGTIEQHDNAATRKVSMPSLGTTTTTTITEQSFTLLNTNNSSSFGKAIQELRAPDTSSIHSHSMMATPSSYESHRYLDANDPFIGGSSPSASIAQHRTPSNVSLASGTHPPLARHPSGRMSVSSPKGNTLKKNPSERDMEGAANRKMAALPSSPPPPAAPTSPKSSPRPKLSVATTTTTTSAAASSSSSSQYFHTMPPPPPPPEPEVESTLNGQLSPVGSPSAKGSTGRSVARSIIRHVKSGSSLRGGGPDEPSSSFLNLGGSQQEGLSNANANTNARAKKKKSGAFGMFANAFP